MLKKIPVGRLRPGMFIHEMCGDWMSHPFWRAQFVLKADGDLRRIVDAGIQHVYIDTDRGLDDVEAVAADEVKAAVEEEISAALSAPPEQILRVSVREEMARARKVHEQAHKVVRTMMSDVRLGKAVTLEDAEPVVEAITGSVLRNSGALMGLIGIKNKDDYTFLHSVSVCTLMIAFGRSLGLAGDELRQGGIGGLLHDIGKMKVPDEVLNKPGRLTDAEFDLIKQHPGDGHAVLLETAGIGPVPLDITRHHHERLDGSGYPDKLAGDAISTMARMAAIVDVYDAITADRCYHKGLPAAEALRKMWEWSTDHFDQKLLQAFMRCVGIYPVGSLVKLESGRLGVVIEQNDSSLLTPRLRVFFSTKSNGYIKPEVVDLGRKLGSGGGDRIVSA
ncbi:MAG: HD-GYP domain-containing protein, partial [Zoogloea sp.]|nr:HD-GYP domain-containing protein [Zoogloea sp.]